MSTLNTAVKSVVKSMVENRMGTLEKAVDALEKRGKAFKGKVRLFNITLADINNSIPFSAQTFITAEHLQDVADEITEHPKIKAASENNKVYVETASNFVDVAISNL